jgi:hypothetical protein
MAEVDDRTAPPLVARSTKVKLGLLAAGGFVGLVLGLVVGVAAVTAWNRFWEEDNYADVRSVKIIGTVVEPDGERACVRTESSDPPDDGTDSSTSSCGQWYGSAPVVGSRVAGVLAYYCEMNRRRQPCDSVWLSLDAVR